MTEAMKHVHPPPNRPFRRGRETEDGDYEHTVQKMLDQDFDDWPNEAGFEGLTEVRGPVGLPVKGKIPSWAAGTLYRTGPGDFQVNDTPKGTYRTTHWFDGFGQSHKFDIIPEDTNPDTPVKVEYSSRRQTQDLIDQIRQEGGRSGFSFGQRSDPCIGLFGKTMSVWRMLASKRSPNTDNVSVTVQANMPGFRSQATQASQSGHRAGVKSMWLTTDTNTVKEMDQNTLEPIGLATQDRLHPLLRGPLSCAHAQRDPETGDMFNYNLEMGASCVYRIFRANAATGTTDILATVSEAGVKPAYIHSFFLSPSFVILCVPSTHLRGNGLQVIWHRNIIDAIEPFDENRVCKWLVIDRKGDLGVVATFESPAGFFFHSINSFEERDTVTGDTVVYCDAIEYPTTDVIRAFEMDVLLRNEGMTQNFWGDETRNRNSLARLVRHKLVVPNSSVSGTSAASVSRRSTIPMTLDKTLEIKAPHAGELPTINPEYATKKYRYVYSLPNRGFSTLLDSIAKTDLETCETVFWDNPKGHTPGEAIFVPRPRSKDDGEEGELAEDDGVLLSVILDGFGKTSYLLCLDAKTMKELGRAECGWAVAHGFHGLHTPAA
ncbi:beta,beta-carotene 9',10'-dioxygenase [Pseudomassariella vexata]|uniref:Beta,beta-carotene 9',10'-dioxygenase n=1 Tax=Pseudomassariella vexata TaxID=1141098 RepID=A0A1Y2DAR3_9PEZI|nr:beta,beta-carotene 9',10'-dioxygenase [Pseudomassariella vexata]ORY56358.1 beta,beta-carotene 9',10'-dioxygenase [Pseudomassariella vexata]